MSNLSTMWLHLEQPNDVAPRRLTNCKLYSYGSEPKFLSSLPGLEDHLTVRISVLSFGWIIKPFRHEGYTLFEELLARPASFDRLVDFARTISEGILSALTDFYGVGGEHIFSELMYHPYSGFIPFVPREWDLRVGGRTLCKRGIRPIREAECPIA